MEINFGSVDVSLVNTVRRIMLRDVYTYAIEKVIINENTSIMQDEVLADRLALVPLRVVYSWTDAPKHVSLNIHVTCDTGTKNVYSRDLVCDDNNTSADVSIPYPDILLVTLSEGQSINVNAKCIQGNGERHYKFSPTTVVDVVKEEDNTKLYVELTGQLTKDELLTEVSTKLNSMVRDVTETIKNSMDN